MVRVVFTAFVLLCPPSWAKPAAGTFADPIVVDAFPYVIKGTTDSCAVYRFHLEAPARVTAWVDSGGVQLDASACAAGGPAVVEGQLDSGDHTVVVSVAGSYVVHLDAIGDDWIVRPIADGAEWRARRFTSVAGGPQVVSQLRISSNSVTIRALAGCRTVGDLGAAAGAIAGVNGGFFDAACAPTSLLKASGVLAGKNTSTWTRGAFGLAPSPSPSPLVALVAPNADWPAAFEAHGGGPVLAHAGVPRVGAAAWSLEGFNDPSFTGIGARTVAGFDAAGAVVFLTVDGKRADALGMSLDALSVFATGEIALADAVNLDGGASTTMWIAGATPDGVVNYPTTEDATHPGARAVSGGWFLFAPPYDHPPRFQTVPPGDASVGAPYVYDADAIDLDVDDVLTYRLETPPAGVTVDSTSGVVQFTPSASDPPQLGLTLVVSDGRGGEARQSWLITIAGATGPAPSESTGGCGCSLQPAPAPFCCVLFVLYLSLRRKHA